MIYHIDLDSSVYFETSVQFNVSLTPVETRRGLETEAGVASPSHGQIMGERMWIVMYSNKTNWWFQLSTHLKNISQVRSFPQVGVNI